MSEIQKLLVYEFVNYEIQLNLVKKKFALKIEMDRTYLASVESGKRNISIVNLEKIIKGLNITFAEFFENM